MKKLSLKLAFSTVVLGAFLVGCGDNRFVEFEPEDELDKIALETFKKELPDKVAYRDNILNKDGDIIDDFTKREKGTYYNYQLRFKDEKSSNPYNKIYIEMNCYTDKKMCEVIRIRS